MRNYDRRQWITVVVAGAGIGGVVGPVFGQEKLPPQRRLPPGYRFGTVVAVSGNTILVSTRDGPLTLYAADDLRVWKGRYTAETSVLKTGDSIQARCYVQPDGKVIAREIWANHVGFGGVIREVKGDTIEVLIAGPSNPSVVRTVRVDDETVFEYGRGSKRDLAKGRFIQLVGLALEDGTVRATWAVVYEGGRPLHLDKGARIMPRTGPDTKR